MPDPAILGAGASVVGGIFQSNAVDEASQAQRDAAAQANETQLKIYNQMREDLGPWRQAGRAGLSQILAGIGEDPNVVFGASPAATAAPAPGTPSPTATLSGTPVLAGFQADGTPLFQAGGAGPLAPMPAGAAGGATSPTQWWVEARNPNPNPDLLRGGTPLAAATAASRDPSQAEFNRKFGTADFQADPGYAFRMEQGLKALERSASARGNLLSGGTLKGIEAYGQGLAAQEYQAAFDRFQSERTGRYNRLAALAQLGQTANTSLGNAGVATGAGVAGTQVSLGSMLANNALAQGSIWGNTLNNVAGNLGPLLARNPGGP